MCSRESLTAFRRGVSLYRMLTNPAMGFVRFGVCNQNH